MIRLCNLCSLIFFVFIFPTCQQVKQRDIAIVWNNKHAVAISVPKGLLDDNAAGSTKELPEVRLEKNSGAMLGDYDVEDDEVIFKPLIPLSRGLSYEIFFHDKIIGRVTVPSANPSDAPKLVSVYPTADTLPENLLKMYLQFSRRMREGQSKQYIALLDHNNDTVPGVFLDLQPELWNEERTVLTIWLDPGRIKRELIPNQKLGNPLQKGERYTLTVSGSWKDEQGLALQQPSNKQFMVGARDSLSPDHEKWVLNLPAANTKQSLQINLCEPLDNFLLQETLNIVDGNGKLIPGKIEVTDKGKKVLFIPDNTWKTGYYRLQVESILEDLAGNNLNRVFDRYVRVKNLKRGKPLFERIFEIKN